MVPSVKPPVYIACRSVPYRTISRGFKNKNFPHRPCRAGRFKSSPMVVLYKWQFNRWFSFSKKKKKWQKEASNVLFSWCKIQWRCSDADKLAQQETQRFILLWQVYSSTNKWEKKVRNEPSSYVMSGCHEQTMFFFSLHKIRLSSTMWDWKDKQQQQRRGNREKSVAMRWITRRDSFKRGNKMPDIDEMPNRTWFRIWFNILAGNPPADDDYYLPCAWWPLKRWGSPTSICDPENEVYFWARRGFPKVKTIPIH